MRARALLFVVALAGATACSDRSPLAPPAPVFSVGGTVTGLAGSGLILTNDFVDSVAVAGGTFTFAATYEAGALYSVRVARQPTIPDQVCTVANGTGLIAAADVTDVAVTCVTPLDNEDLDPGFNDDGRATADLVDGAHDMVLLGDGRIVLINPHAVARFTANGNVDPTFGNGGSVAIDFPGTFDRLHALAVQGDGKLIIAGSTQYSAVPAAAITRLLPDGAVDSTFGTNGVYSPAGTRSAANDVLVQPDGRIVYGGPFVRPDGDSDFMLVRLMPDGVPDPNFGSDGVAIVEIGFRTEIPHAIALQADGRILIAGRAATSGGATPDIAVARVLPDGRLDPDFGSGGTFGTLTPDIWDEPLDIIVQPDGRIVLAGTFDPFGPSPSRFLVMRLNANGSPDMSFGTGGYAEWAVFSDQHDYALALTLAADGRIIVVGQKASHGQSDFAIARYNADGTLDTTFGTGGMSAVDFHGDVDIARAVAITVDGGILVAGMAREGNVTRVAMARLRP